MSIKRSRRLKHIIALVTLLFVFQNGVGSQTRVDESLGLLTGSVLDQKGAVILIPKPVIVVRGNNTVKEITVNENGRFEASLPTGTYYVTTEIPGFYPFRRAPFRVTAGRSIMINLVPSRRYLVRGTSVSAKDTADKVAPRPRYESFRVTPKSPLSGLIRFELREHVGRHVRYKFAVFSYDNMTVYADELVFNRKALRMTAAGKVVILEDGRQRVEVKGIAVSFNRGEVHVDLKRD